MSLTLSAFTVASTVTTSDEQSTIIDKCIQALSFPFTGGATDVLTLGEVRYVAVVWAVVGFVLGCIMTRLRIVRALAAKGQSSAVAQLKTGDAKPILGFLL